MRKCQKEHILGDAGNDVFFCPEIESSVVMKPGDSKLFQTGLKVATPHGWVCEVKNRSGMAAKKSLVVGACIVDSGYDLEVFVNLHNIGNMTQIVSPGDKIAQLVFYKVELPTFNELNLEKDLYSETEVPGKKTGRFIVQWVVKYLLLHYLLCRRQKMRKEWTQEECQYLIDNYKTKEYTEIAKVLGRTESSVGKKAIKLKLMKKNEEICWQDWQLDFLKENYGKISAKEISEKINKTKGTVIARAAILGLGIQVEENIN
jgi:dUTP pyrophosphatase